MADLRELAKAALECWFCESNLDSDEGIARDRAARAALFAAIDRQDAEREALERVARAAVAVYDGPMKRRPDSSWCWEERELSKAIVATRQPLAARITADTEARDERSRRGCGYP